MELNLPQKLQTVDEIQDAINKLQAARDRLVQEQKVGVVEASNGSFSDDQHLDDLIDVSLLDDSDQSQWLVKTTWKSAMSNKDLEADRSYVDFAMLNSQNTLVYHVKSLIFEHNTKKIMQQSATLRSNLNNPNGSANLVQTSVLKPSPPSKPSVRHKQEQESPETETEFLSPIKKAVNNSSPLTNVSRFAKIESPDLNIEADANFNPSNNYFATPARSIDTRTYTRPKKTRMSLEGPLKGGQGSFNSLTLKKDNLEVMLLDETFEYPNTNNNLNSTFVQSDTFNETVDTKQENEEERAMLNTTITFERSPGKHVVRNNSYVIQKKENSNNLKGSDLNSTFSCGNEDSASPTDSNSGSAHNLSMEEIHVMARLQEQALKEASPRRTIARKDTRTLMTFSNLDVKRPTRTSSTDTYCVGQSNPDSPSPGSSGLSSPMDAQSYDNLQSDAFRRSMPDLAITRRLSSGAVSGGTLSLMPPQNMGVLKSKPYHTSDTRLSHSGNSRLSMLKPVSTASYNRNFRNPSPDLMSSSSSIETNMPARPLTGRVSDMGIYTRNTQRPLTGLSQPRFSSKPVITRPQSMLPTPGFSQIGGIRPQSRIPAPGSVRPRLSRPNGTINRSTGAKQTDWKEGCY